MSRKLAVRVLHEARETWRSCGATNVFSGAFHPSAGLSTGHASWQPTRSQPQPLAWPKPAGREAELRLGRAQAARICDVAGVRPETAGLGQGRAFTGTLPAGWMLHHRWGGDKEWPAARSSSSVLFTAVRCPGQGQTLGETERKSYRESPGSNAGAQEGWRVTGGSSAHRFFTYRICKFASIEVKPGYEWGCPT